MKWQIQKDKYLSPNELEQLFKKLSELESQDRAQFRSRWLVAHMALDLAFSCGLRVGELRLIKHKDIDLQSELPSLHIRNGKGGKRRFIPIPTQLKEHIKRFVLLKKGMGLSIEPDSYFLQSPKGGCYSVSGLEQMFIESLKQAQLPRRTIHSLRHSYGFKIYNLTKDLRATMQLLGHANLSTTQVYTDVQFDKLSSYVNLLGRG